MPCISLAATATASTIWPILRSKSVASSRIATSRSSLDRSPGLAALGVGARLGGGRSFGFGRLLRGCHEQARELVSKPDQDAGLDPENDGMKDDAPNVTAAGIDRRRKNEVQHQVMQDDRDRAGNDRPIVAIGDQTCQRGKEVHVEVDLPGDAPIAGRQTPICRPSRRPQQSDGSKVRSRLRATTMSRPRPAPPSRRRAAANPRRAPCRWPRRPEHAARAPRARSCWWSRAKSPGRGSRRSCQISFLQFLF